MRMTTSIVKNAFTAMCRTEAIYQCAYTYCEKVSAVHVPVAWGVRRKLQNRSGEP